MLNIKQKKKNQLANDLYNLIMKYNDPELGLNYLYLKPALKRFVNKHVKM